MQHSAPSVYSDNPSGHFFKSFKSLIKTAVKKIAPVVSAVKKTISKTVTKVATKATATVKKVTTTVKKTVTTVSKAASVTVKKATTTVKTTAKKVVKVAKKVSKNKTVRKVAIGTAVIGACAAATILTGGACASVAGAVAAGALKEAVFGAASGAVTGGVVSEAKYAVENKTLAGSAGAIAEGMASGYASGAISGAISGAVGGFLKGPQCFVAGTPIATATGLVAIETIEAGDLILAADPETGVVAYKKVVQVFKKTTNELTHVTISNHNGVTETIDATPQHPFYVDGIGWVEASSLHEGMTVWFADGSMGTVADISNEGLAEPVAVDNFEVEDFHTYFIGGNEVLVHNSCEPKYKTEYDTRRQAFRASKRYSNIPVTEHPIDVRQARNKLGMPIPGRDYFFKNGTIIREHFGHPEYNIGPHFNVIKNGIKWHNMYKY